jgi:hypothetical protein
MACLQPVGCLPRNAEVKRANLAIHPFILLPDVSASAVTQRFVGDLVTNVTI